jgi:ubiquinone/menaquinone biosynthesis C-methylase UbiE
MSIKNNEILTWEETIVLLRKSRANTQWIRAAYLEDDLSENCSRYSKSNEFNLIKEIIYEYKRDKSIKILDVAAGNGISTISFGLLGYSVDAIEPDPSETVGRGAINSMAKKYNLSNINVIDSYGENTNLNSEAYDVVFIRQGLHHADDIKLMLKEFNRLLKRDGLLLSIRDHVVDNYGESLERFLDSQIDHQYYKGENAYTLKDYIAFIKEAGFMVKKVLTPYSNQINLNLSDEEILKKIMQSTVGKWITMLFGKKISLLLNQYHNSRKKIPGRLYSFVAIKEDK